MTGWLPRTDEWDSWHEETGRHGLTGRERRGYLDRRDDPPRAYLADFNWVRRQRVQTSARVGVPFSTMTSGWRFGCIRR